MKTTIVFADDPTSLGRAVEVLHRGGIIAIPTDTVYGLGALVNDEDAVRRIYWAKQRPPEKAIPILIGDIKDLALVASNPSLQSLLLANHFWPGPLTLVVPKNPSISLIVSATPEVGVRIPAFPFTRKLLQLVGPMAVTSANISGQDNPSTAAEVLEQLEGRIDLVVDGGEVGVGLASTVVRCPGELSEILRQGAVTMDEMKKVLGL